MTHKRNNNSSDPSRAYNDELHDKGNSFHESEQEGDARDLAKVEKANTGHGQKIDSISPDELEMDRNDRIMEERKDLD